LRGQNDHRNTYIYTMRLIFVTCFFLYSGKIFSQEWIMQDYQKFATEYQEQKLSEALVTGSNFLEKCEKANRADTVYSVVAYYMGQISFSQGDYVNATKWAGKACNSRGQWQGKNNLEYAATTYFYGICFGYQLDYEKGLPYMEEAAVICKKLLGEFHSYTLHYYNQYANTLNAAGSYYKANEIFTHNWDLAQKHYAPTDSMYQVTANAVSQFYTVTGDYIKSEPFFISSLEMTEKQYGKVNQYYFNVLEQTLQFYKLAKWNDKIEKTYLDILYVFGKSNGEDSKDYYNLCDAVAQFYIEAGWYDKAQKIYEKLLTLASTLFGKKSADYATALNNIAVTLEKQGKYKEAEKLYLQAIDLKATVYKKNSGYYALSLLNLSVLYYYMGEYAKADKKAKEALDTYETAYGKESIDYAMALSNAASIYSGANNAKESLRMLEESIGIFKKASKTETPEYINALDNLAGRHADLGEYEKAEKEYTEIILLREKVQGKDHVDVGNSLFNFANFESKRGNYTEAEKMLNQSYEIHVKNLGENNVQCAKIKQVLADVYASTGRYTKAETTYDQCAGIFGKTIGKLHPEYAIYLGNRGLFYYRKGDYENAQKYIDQALAIHYDTYGNESEKNIPLFTNLGLVEMARHNYKESEKLFTWCANKTKETLGDKHPDYAVALNSLAQLYYELGNYPKSQELYENALALRKDIYGDKHQEYAISLNNLGTVYMARAFATKDVKERNDLSLTAAVQFKKALTIDSVVYGGNNIEISGNLNNLAEAYRLRNESGKAEKLYLQCLTIEQNYLGTKNLKSAVTLHNLALLYTGMNDFDKAEKCANNSVDMFSAKLGNMCPQAAGVISTLAYIQDLKGENGQARSSYHTALLIQQRELKRNFTFLSEEEKEKYLASIVHTQNYFNAFALKIKSEDKSIVEDVYRGEIENKGMLLRSSTRMKTAVLTSGNANLIEMYAKWIDMKEQLSALYATPIENRISDVEVLENQVNQLEKNLIEGSSEIRSAIAETSISSFDVKSKLLPTQAAVEFIRFSKENTTGQEVYGAIILRKEYKYPEMIELCTAAAIDSVLGTHAANNLAYVNALYDANGKLYQTVWAPLEKYLADINEVFYSPTGSLHKISFSSLRSGEGTYVANKYQLHALNSTAAIVSLSPVPLDPAKSTLVMFGGVKYSTDQTKNEVWKYLPGTLTEANDIKKAVSKSGMQASSFTGTEATEKTLKDLDGKKSPELLHVATHGFFFGDPEETKKQIHVEEAESVDFRGGSRGTKTLVENTNPLMRSGIVLAGANDIWNENNKAEEDGVLTAYEVSLLNLQNTKLAVLSACETGLGDIKGSEGVYGLQRAFRIAGVKQLIISLWQVPDKETEEFMVSFYTNLVKVKNTNQAFEMTQKNMRAKYEPYYWGAFVLVE
jgi:CHAT domain-containing protein/Flp pilus assembly protein TadD